jgi:predicted transcriptional regulator
MKDISSVTLSSTRSGHRGLTPEAIAAVEAILKENRCVTVNEMAARLDMSRGSAHHIVHDFLQFHKCVICNILINI